MLIVLWEDEYNSTHKKAPRRFHKFEEFLQLLLLCFSIQNWSSWSQDCSLQGRFFRVFWAHQVAHTNPIIFFVPVRYFGHGDCKKMLYFSFGGRE